MSVKKTPKNYEELLFMFLNVLGELSNFAMGTILGKTLAQAQVVTNHSTSAEVYDDEKFMRIPRFSGLRVPY